LLELFGYAIILKQSSDTKEIPKRDKYISNPYQKRYQKQTKELNRRTPLYENEWKKLDTRSSFFIFEDKAEIISIRKMASEKTLPLLCF